MSGARRLRQAARRKFLLQHLRRQCSASQVLAETVVQVLADAPLLALHHIEKFRLETLALGDMKDAPAIYQAGLSLLSPLRRLVRTWSYIGALRSRRPPTTNPTIGSRLRRTNARSTS